MGGEEEKGKHRNGHGACSAARPLLLLWLAEVQWLAVVGTDPSTGKRSSVAGQWPSAVVGFVFNNLLFKGIFGEFFTLYRVPFPWEYHDDGDWCVGPTRWQVFIFWDHHSQFC